MGKNFFAKIAELINGTHTDGESIPQSDNKSGNSIDKKGDLLNAVISTLKSNYAGTKISLKEYSLFLWIDDNLFYNSLMLDKFQDAAQLKLWIAATYAYSQLCQFKLSQKL